MMDFRFQVISEGPGASFSDISARSCAKAHGAKHSPSSLCALVALQAEIQGSTKMYFSTKSFKK